MSDPFVHYLEENEYPVSGLRNFFTCDRDKIPEKGAYILFSGDGTKWRYPKSDSSVFYIGQSCELPRRLIKEHLKFANHAKNNSRCSYEYYSAKYEFAAAFKAKYMIVYTWQNIQPSKLEGWVLYEFIKKFGSLPLANNKADNNVWEMLEI